MKQARVAVCGLGLMLMCLVAISSADPAPAPQSPSINQAIDQRQLEAMTSGMDEDKRAWQNLHGGWGKRGWQDMNSAWGKRAWQNLHGGWGKRGWQDMNSAWGKRGWKDMNSAWGKRTLNNDLSQRQALGDLVDNWNKKELLDLLEASNAQPAEADTLEQFVPIHQILSGNSDKLMNEINDQDMDKRTWSSLHGTWGKRSASKWDNFRGSWGKRQPGWNNLKGLWGKRSSLDSMDDSPSEFTDRQDE